MSVLEVDRRGLAKKLGKRPKSFLVFELMSNAWDEDISYVEVSIEMLPGRPTCRVTVADDCPEGFQDLTSVYTMFRDSKKAPDPTKRGRFELGEKLVIALAQRAEIISTKGSIIIEDEERKHSKKKLEAGTIFTGDFRVTREEFAEIERAVRQVIPPKGIRTTFNGEALPSRTPVHTFETTLQTIRADEEGNLSTTSRKTAVEVYEVLPGETAHIYEMGLPVVETGDKWHYNVLQRVPVNWERNNVPPSYKKTLRVEVLNAMHARLTTEEAVEGWVTDALEDERAVEDAVKDVVVKRFGEKAVIYDPSDPEGTKLAVSKGYTVIHGGTLPKGAWENVRRFETVLPAGQVTPSPKVYDPNGRPENVVPESEWTDSMRSRVGFAQRFFRELTGDLLDVRIVREPTAWWLANYGKGHGLCLNASRLGKDWFNQPHRDVEVLDLLIHEFGHHYSSDHLEEKFHDALTRLGAKAVNLALNDPRLFE